jgi:hypothetical protein
MQIATFHAFPCIAEHFAGLCEPPADGGFGAVSNGRNIGSAETFEVPEDEDGAVGFRKFQKDSLNLE